MQEVKSWCWANGSRRDQLSIPCHLIVKLMIVRAGMEGGNVQGSQSKS